MWGGGEIKACVEKHGQLPYVSRAICTESQQYMNHRNSEKSIHRTSQECGGSVNIHNLRGCDRSGGGAVHVHGYGCVYT